MKLKFTRILKYINLYTHVCLLKTCPKNDATSAYIFNTRKIGWNKQPNPFSWASSWCYPLWYLLWRPNIYEECFFLSHFWMTGEFAEIAKNDHIILLCIHSLGISEFFVINLNAVMWKLLSHNRISVWMFLWVNVRHTKIDPFYLFPSFGQRNANRWNNLFKFMWIQTKGPCNALNEKIHGKCNPIETNRRKTVHLKINFFNSTKTFHFKHVFVCLFAWQPLQRPHWITLITRFTFFEWDVLICCICVPLLLKSEGICTRIICDEVTREWR